MTALVPRARVGGRYSTTRSPQWMINQLPVGLLDSDFFVRFVSIFQEVGETLLADADNIENLLDTSVAPLELVRWLGSWIGVDEIDASLPGELQRRIVAGMAETLAWRGTAHGLQRFLELISGGSAEVVDGGGVWRLGEAPEDTAWVRMSVSSTGWLTESDFVTLVRDEVPAHVRAELFVDGRHVWSSATDDDDASPSSGGLRND
jgi:phage tail-like protein